MITMDMYITRLEKIKDKLFIALNLYEKKSPTLDKFLLSFTNVEMYGFGKLIENLPNDKWYVETYSILVALTHQRSPNFDEHAKVKSEIFHMMRLIDNQIRELKENGEV